MARYVNQTQRAVQPTNPTFPLITPPKSAAPCALTKPRAELWGKLYRFRHALLPELGGRLRSGLSMRTP